MSGTLRLRGATSGYSELQAPAVAADQTFILPTAGGTLLTTDSPVAKLTLELGSASQPSLTFEGDTDTGLYSSGTNTLNLVTGGSNRLIIDSSGNVGIGTTSPDDKLHVNGAIRFNSNSPTLAASDGGLIDYVSSSGEVRITAARTGSNSSKISFITYNSGSLVEAVRIDSSGVVRIGGTSTYNSSDKLTLVNDSGNCSLTIDSTSTGESSIFLADGPTGSEAYRGYLQYQHSSDALLIGTAGSEALRIDSSGNVGIGRNNPTAKLALQTSSDDDIFQVIGYNFLKWNGGNQLHYGGYDSSQWGTLTFSTSGSERLRINASGDVGIGTSSPTSYANSQKTLVIEDSGNPAICWSDTGQTRDWWAVALGSALSFRYADGGGSGSATNVTNVLQLDNSGNVGIGTTSPDRKLHVAGDWIRVDDGYGLDTSGGTEKVKLDNGYIALTTASLERMRIDSAGNVGIGATSINNSYGTNVNIHTTTTNGARLKISDGTSGNGNTDGLDIIHQSGIAYIIQRENNDIRISTNNTERMRISADGSFKQYTDDHFNIYTARTAATGAGIIVLRENASGYNGTIVFRVASNGNVTNTNNSYGAISDAKLKENIVDANSQWNDIKALQVRNYNFIEGQTHTQIGVVAQEVETVSPGLVSESPDVDDDGNDLGTTTKSVNYSVLYMKAVKALQEAMDRIETLEANNLSLENRIAALENN